MSPPEAADRETSAEKLKELVVEVLDDMKAQDVVALHVAEKTTLADWFLLCTGTSDVHCRAIAAEVAQRLKDEGIAPLNSASQGKSSWTLLDYGAVIVHVLSRDARERYRLELLWDEGGKHVVEDGGEA